MCVVFVESMFLFMGVVMWGLGFIVWIFGIRFCLIDFLNKCFLYLFVFVEEIINVDWGFMVKLGYFGGDEGENIDVMCYVWMVEIGFDMLGENVEVFKCSRIFIGFVWGECLGLVGGVELRGLGWVILL